MEHLPMKQNKLVQAIRQGDWPAVRNILENEPHLNETFDEDGLTPLMHAVMYGAPDDVLENMIETATVECLEQQSRLFAGSTILHLLAIFARVSAMRRVLEKTNKNINTQDEYGRTPLHDCLENEKLTHEQHKEVAILNITFGASLTIKNNDGKTPLDLYDENECTEYEETTRSKKKQDLKELLEKLSTPSEILARGPDAVKAFKDALKNGEITVVNSRLMFLGQEGSGKTSCVKAMLGKEFNKEEPSTDGIVTTIVFQTDGDYSKWEEQKDVDECEQTRQILEHGIATDVSKKIEQLKSEQNKNKYKNSSDLGVTSSPGSVASTSAAVVEQSEAEITKEKPVSQYTGLATNQLVRHEKVLENMVTKSTGPMDVTCIWDYAGQLDYYITHRFFLTDGSSYGVVFSLFDDLNKMAKPRDSHKVNFFLRVWRAAPWRRSMRSDEEVKHFEMTNLQMILFFIRSIYEHAVLLHGSKETLINGVIASPPISLIGTHKDLLTGTDAEKLTKITDIFKTIFKEIEGTPYERHVDRHMYAVDNTAKCDDGIKSLKKNVGSYMNSMARTVPLKWVEFQIKLQDVGKTTLRMSIDKIKKIAVECDVNEENIIHVLNYLNDLGTILYLPTNKNLENTVITNIRMLIGIFMKIITVVKPDGVDKAPVMVKYWRKLNEGGILEEPLARYLWRNELKSCEDDDDVVFKDFIELMKAFGLLFEKIKKAASEDGPRVFVVPSRMKTKDDDRLEVKEDEKQTVSIYVTPKDFLPDAVYDILVVRFVSLSQEKGYCDDPKLFQNQAKILFDDKHYLRLGRISIDNKRSLKLEISRMKERGADGTNKSACKPHPDVCKEVLQVLKQHLGEVYPSKRVVGYALKILCLVCSNTEEPHFQELEYCLKNENMTCDKTGELITMPAANVQKLFAAGILHQSSDTADQSSATATPHQSSATDTSHRLACSDEDFRMLKFVVSNWYDRHESLPMLKVLFRDHVEHGVLSTVTNTMDLLNILFRLDHLRSQKLELLFDTINITKHFRLLSKIKEELSSFPDEKEGSIFTKFTSHRQTLMRIGMALTRADVKQIDGFYNTPCKKYTDAWEMITDLENRMEISEGNMKEFTNILEKLRGELKDENISYNEEQKYSFIQSLFKSIFIFVILVFIICYYLPSLRSFLPMLFQ